MKNRLLDEKGNGAGPHRLIHALQAKEEQY